MPDEQALDDRQHAIEFQKMLARPVPLCAWHHRTSIHTLARFEPADEQTHQARAILNALWSTRVGPRPASWPAKSAVPAPGPSFGGSRRQLADEFVRDNESATKYDDIRQIVDKRAESSRGWQLPTNGDFMELAIAEARKSKSEDRGAASEGWGGGGEGRQGNRDGPPGELRAG